MRTESFDTPMNPYHYVLHCIGGKWKMTILHEIYVSGSIRFNQTLKLLPISEKVFSQQLRELVEAGLIRRISYDTVPPKVEYVLTPSGEKLIPALCGSQVGEVCGCPEGHHGRQPLLAGAGAPARRPDRAGGAELIQDRRAGRRRGGPLVLCKKMPEIFPVLLDGGFSICYDNMLEKTLCI